MRFGTLKNIMPSSFVSYQQSRFSTRLPAEHLYTSSHYWIAKYQDSHVWRVGFTQFATRMLGELVECEFDVQVGEKIQAGQVIGWVEGFKAASDLYCVMTGEFEGGNPDLKENACVIRSDPYGQGWLYQAKGKPDPQSVDVQGYVHILDETIERLKAKYDAKESHE